MKDKNIAVRVEWATWSLLEQIRAERETQRRETVSLSEIVREALENHVGKTWDNTTN